MFSRVPRKTGLDREKTHGIPCSRRDKSSGDVISSGLIFFEVYMAWISLMFAGVFEVVRSVGLKYSHGFSRLVRQLLRLWV